jgi:pyridoxamine 5'-phosphate oxidase family protein
MQTTKLIFSEVEINYLKTQRLARIATVSAKGQPDVAPVGFEFDDGYFYIGGRDNPSTLKYRNIQKGNTLAALVVDDLESVNPWKPRGIKIHGTAEIVEYKGRLGDSLYLRITPTRYWSWGIEKPVLEGGRLNLKKEGQHSTSANQG